MARLTFRPGWKRRAYLRQQKQAERNAYADKVDAALLKVRAELLRARKLHGPFNSTHEGYGVLAEEFHELFLEIIANNNRRAKAEAMQVAAMATSFIVDC